MVYSLLRNEKAVRSFAQVSSDVASLRRSLTAANASSVNTSSTASALGDEDFSFDHLVINSTAYRNAFVRQQNRLRLQDNSRGSASSPENGSTTATIRSETTVKPTRESKKGKTITSSEDFGVFPRGALGRLLGGLFYKEVIKEPGTTASIFRTHSDSRGYEVLPGGRIARISALEDPFDAPSPSRRPAQPPAQPQKSEQPSFFNDHYSNDKIFVRNLVSVIWSYQSKGADEFTLERGHVLKVVGMWDDGWARGVMYPARAESLTDGEHEGEVPSEIERKTFPLACVCLPQHWRRLIEGDAANN
jgi:hypothetical protein